MRETLPLGGHQIYDRLVGRPLADFYGRLAEDFPAGRILDIGCGPGHLAGKLLEQNRDVIAADKDPVQVRIASRNHPGLDVREEDAGQLNFEDASFDVVVTSESYHHWPDTQAGAKEAARVLRPGGSFIVIEGAADVSKTEVASFMGRKPLPGFTTISRMVFRKHGYSKAGLEEHVLPVLGRHFAEVTWVRRDGWWIVTGIKAR